MTLCDTGPLVALINRGEKNHSRCATALPKLSQPLITTWPCIAETMHLVGEYGGHPAQDKLWEYFSRGVLTLHELDGADRERMRLLMRQYSDTPMDLADASLVVAAEALHLQRIFTLDRDFFIYRLANGEALEVVPRGRSSKFLHSLRGDGT